MQRKAGRRRVLAKADRGTHTKGQWEKLLRAFDYRCACCGVRSTALQKDHIRPLSRGGTDTIDNLQPLCATCNREKGAAWVNYLQMEQDIVMLKALGWEEVYRQGPDVTMRMYGINDRGEIVPEYEAWTDAGNQWFVHKRTDANVGLVSTGQDVINWWHERENADD